MKSERKDIIYLFFVIFLFAGLSVIDCIVGSQTGRIQFVAKNCLGVVIAFLILSNYSFRDYLKPCFYIWTGIFILITPFALYWGIKNYPYKGQFISALIDILLFGYVIIQSFIQLIIKKNRPKFNYLNLSLWSSMMILMIITAHGRLWPICYFIMFSALYLTNFVSKKIKSLILGIPVGIILGFFLIQGSALLFRPYDNVRYYGMYANSNNNSLFYLMVFCASLCLLVRFYHNKKPLLYKIAALTILDASLSLSFLSSGRTALLAEFCLLIMFGFIILRFIKKRTLLKICLLFFLIFVLLTPIVYCFVRYIPTIHLHPIYFEGEYSEFKILPGDPKDSEKYISPDEILKFHFERIYDILPNEKKTVSDTSTVDASSLDTTDFSSNATPVRNLNSIEIRKLVYTWYFRKLNLMGHSANDEPGVYIDESYTAPHAHNIYLQFGFWFGIPVLIIFLLLIALSYVKMFKLLVSKEYNLSCIIGFFVTALCIFGLFEINYHIGSLSLSMFFVALLFVIQDHSIESDS